MNQLQLNMGPSNSATFILDAGKIVARDLRGDELRAKIKSF
jgi:hypothetical protein